MDESAERALELAYLSFKRENKRREPSVAVMQRLMMEQWTATRLNTVSAWADEIQARVGRERLLGKLETVFELLERARVDWEWPWDEVEAVNTVAWGLATLRWINRAAAGRCPPRPECADEEIRDWLDARKTRQLSLW